MKKLITIGGAILLMAQLVACSKKDGNNVPVNPNTGANNTLPTLNASEKMLTGNWKLKSILEYYSDYNGTNSTTEIMQDCQKDDVFTFNDSLKYVVSDGAVSCSSVSNYSSTGKWSLADGDSILQQFYYFQPLLTYQAPTIEQLDQTTLKFKIAFTNTAYGNEWMKYKFEYIFQRQ